MTRHSPTGDVFTDPLPTAEALLRAELARSLPFDHPDWPHLVEQAKAGDVQARHTLILSSLKYASPLAQRCARLSSHTDYLEYLQVAALAMLEHMETAFAKTERPDKFLYGVAKRAILNQLDGSDPLITTPRGEFPWRCDSLDHKQFGAEESVSYADFLPAPAIMPFTDVEPASELKHAFIALLPQMDEMYQLVLTLRYGLSEQDGRELSAQEIARRLGLTTERVEHLLQHALIVLRRRYYRAQRQPIAPDQAYYHPSEVMHLLGLTRPRLDRWVYNGKLTRSYLPGSHREGVYAKSDIDRLVEERSHLDAYYTASEALARLGMSEKSFHRAIKRGQITPHRFSTSRRNRVYAKAEIDRLAEERRARPRSGDARMARRTVAYA